MELQDQIKAYTAWMNSQLKKRSLHINDLSIDLKDGYLLGTAVEVVSGQNLNIVKPNNQEESRENIQKIKKFMINTGINVHHISVEEVIAGKVKPIMQLILALAAHFKPSSIAGRRHSHSDKPHRSPALSKQRWKKDDNSMDEVDYSEDKLELEADLASVRQLAEHLQKLLLEGLDSQPTNNCHSFEESNILESRLDQAICENTRIKDENKTVKSELHELRTENLVITKRLQHHEQEILHLKQDLLQANMERDRLLSEKTELADKLEDIQLQCDRLMKQGHKKDLLLQEIADELHFVKTEQVILLTRKDKELAQLQKQIHNSSYEKDKSARDSSTLKLSSSPVFSRSPAYLKSNVTPHILRHSPLPKSFSPRKTRHNYQQSDTDHTRVLYFSDQDMTPSMTSIAKKVGDITLQDFKKATNKDGNYRFTFKALDPELGTVKEEVLRNDELVPGWEGKIVAWIEEEVRV